MAQRCYGVYAPLSVRRAATKRVGYTITRWDMRGIPTIRPPIGRPRTISGSPLDFVPGLDRRVPDTRLAARKRQNPEGDSLEGLSIEWSPPTSRGERRQMRTRYTMYRTASNNNLVAMFGHRSIFYCDFFPPSGSPRRAGIPGRERGVSLQVYEATSSS